MPDEKLTVLVGSVNEVFGKGFVQLLTEAEMQAAWLAHAEIIVAYGRRADIDVALVSLRLPANRQGTSDDFAGFSVARAMSPGTAVVLIAPEMDRETVTQALVSGARGLLRTDDVAALDFKTVFPRLAEGDAVFSADALLVIAGNSPTARAALLAANAPSEPLIVLPAAELAKVVQQVTGIVPESAPRGPSSPGGIGPKS